MKRIFLIVLHFLMVIFLPGQLRSEESVKPYDLELSFGQSIMFLNQPLFNIPPEGGIAPDNVLRADDQIPTTAASLWASWFFTRTFSGGVLFDIPTSPFRKFKDNGEMLEQQVALMYGAGVNWIFWDFQAFKKARVNLIAGLYGGYTLNQATENDYYVRTNWMIQIETETGNTFYAGTGYYVNLGIRSFMYGVGQKF